MDRGENGLAGGDDGPGQYLHQTWEGYLAGRVPSPEDPRPATYTVKSGDTLAKIAAALGVTLVVLLGVNPQIKYPDVTPPGQTITVPAKPAPARPLRSPRRPRHRHRLRSLPLRPPP